MHSCFLMICSMTTVEILSPKRHVFTSQKLNHNPIKMIPCYRFWSHLYSDMFDNIMCSILVMIELWQVEYYQRCMAMVVLVCKPSLVASGLPATTRRMALWSTWTVHACWPKCHLCSISSSVLLVRALWKMLQCYRYATRMLLHCIQWHPFDIEIRRQRHSHIPLTLVGHDSRPSTIE